ncbi:sulfatase family protein [Diplocloster hominis]|uniref:sulfatase family protein n=1 Tax=Diplocloster hominis TaxID=3079010 RepID=UPI0031BA69DB
MSGFPNVLLLYSDQHSARALGCYGNKEVRTPNLDRLSREGVTFDNAFCNNPLCTPSRMCMLSGQYAHNFGYYGLMGKKPEHLPNLFGYMKRFGYQTAAIGKLHTPAGWVSEQCDFVADGYGFETPVTKENVSMEEGCQGLKQDAYSRYLETVGLAGQRDDKIFQEWYEAHGYAQGQCVDARVSRIPKEHSFEAWCGKNAKEFIGKTNQSGNPFCLWLSMPRPHQTYGPSREFWDLYEGEELEFPPNSGDDMSGRSIAARDTQKSFQVDKDWIAFGPKDFESAKKRVLHGYYACVTQMDSVVGEILDYLDDLKLTDETIIVYMTDHGEFAGEHGMIEKAPGIGFSCVTKIPMIWKYKGCHAGERRESIIESVDVFPTICELAGIKLPNWLDGKSAVSILKNDTPIKGMAVTENATTKTITTSRYKLTQYLPAFHKGEDFGELFDREKDPWELHNLYFEKEYRKVVEELRFQLYSWLVLTTRNVTVHPKIPVMDKGMDVASGVSWDLAEATGICGEDGKIGASFYEGMIDSGHLNYL